MIHIGVSGWTYPHWRGRFYPDGLPHKRELAYLATQLPTVEINGTFYSLTRPTAVERWRTEVPSEFVFAVKGSRYITHMLKLRQHDQPLANFFASGILRLGTQLGPILWQLPPRLRFTRDRLEPFLRALPEDVRAAERLAKRHDQRVTGRCALTAPDGRDARIRYALEVRDASWLCDDCFDLLRKFDVALVAADTAGRHPEPLDRTASFAYVRLHGAEVLYGSRYTDEELDHWAGHIRRWPGDVYVYFDNDNKAYAPDDARRLMARVQNARFPRPAARRGRSDAAA